VKCNDPGLKQKPPLVHESGFGLDECVSDLRRAASCAPTNGLRLTPRSLVNSRTPVRPCRSGVSSSSRCAWPAQVLYAALATL